MTDKERFISIAKTINREGVDKVLEMLETSDFYTAPASTAYHANTKGGLCQHSLHVYDNMVKLRDNFCPDMPDETLKIVSLFHDISKIDFYEEYSKNTKVYSQDGSKRDELGKFDWVAVKSYKTKDAMDRSFICGEHGVNSYMILNKYMKLTLAEASAIINHHAGMDNGFAFKDLSEALNRYPALLLLHTADMLACYIQENPYIVENE